MIILSELLKTKRCQKKVPIWFMRQAGRYLPEYRKLREGYDSFLSFCADPKGASEATLQPLARFDLDAAIIFSDILVVPAALGQDVSFIKGKGPVLKPIRSLEDIQHLSIKNAQEKLSATPEAINVTRSSLDKEKALIGFCGAPWTVMCYMLEGQGSKGFDTARLTLAKNPDLFDPIMALLIEASLTYLKDQVKAGADVIKIFDSWAGFCPSWLRQKAILDPIKQLISGLKADYPETPVIYFPRGTHQGAVQIANHVGADGVAIDQFMDPVLIRDQQESNDLVIQGGLDPMVMAAGGRPLENEIERYLSIFQNQPYIFNMGHGMVPDMPIEHVTKTIEMIRKFG